jgi:signal transduction histidine kinase
VKWRWGLAFAPLIVGATAAWVFGRVEAVQNPVLYARVDLGTLALLIGGFLSAVAAIGLTACERVSRREERRLAGLREETAEERRRFLQRLDHELKNPLTAIRAGLANVIDEQATTSQLEALSSIEAQVLRLSRLTSDLRKLAELETRPLDFAPVDITRLLKEAVSLAQERPSAEGRVLSLTLQQTPWPVPPVMGDWDLLFLAIYNLLDNALKFTRVRDTIEIRAFESSSNVIIEVADTGPGIPQEELPRVWEELYRGRGARGIPGSGLGLALVRAIVDRHSGWVAVRSRHGQGTVVTVRLPAKEASGR